MACFQYRVTAHWICVAFLLAACRQTPPTQTSPLVWRAANQGLTPHAVVTTIAINPADNQSLFAGVYGRDGLYTSNDGGATWQRAGEGVAGQPLAALLFDPRQADRLWAGTADGLYRGLPGATPGEWHWERVAEWPAATAVFDLYAEPNGHIYAAGA